MEFLLTAGMIASAVALVLGTLYVVAVRVRDACDIHDLAHECQTLKIAHMKRLKILAGDYGEDGEGDVIIVD